MAKLTDVSDRPRARVPRWMFALTVVGLVLGVAITVFFVYLSISYSTRTASYDASQICSSAREIAHCRFNGSASVEARRNTSANVLVDLAFADLPDKQYTAYFSQQDSSSLPAMEKGSTLPAELWEGNVTVVASAKTLDNPDTLPKSGPVGVVFFGVVTLVLLGGTAYLVRVDRRAARG